MDQVKKVITRATELTALSVARLIQEQGFSKEDLLTEEESLKRERLIDQAGVDAMYAALTDIPFTLKVVDTFGVEPGKINVVMMDRDRNSHYINACQKFGVNLILIKVGDFMPAILSCMDPKKHNKGIHLVMGSGGFEEGVMAAVCGKILGGVVEGRGWSEDAKIQKTYSKVWSLDELVFGRKADSFVSISAITGEHEWFNLDGVMEENKGHQVSTLTISEDGVKIEKRLHH